ncbi:hypothetical protein SRHO_G00246330 [Serrasalmus rhombeus]
MGVDVMADAGQLSCGSSPLTHTTTGRWAHGVGVLLTPAVASLVPSPPSLCLYKQTHANASFLSSSRQLIQLQMNEAPCSPHHHTLFDVENNARGLG